MSTAPTLQVYSSTKGTAGTGSKADIKPAPAALPELTGLGAVQPHVKTAAQLIARAGGITKVHGWRAKSAYDMGGHPAGLAVDFPCSTEQGDTMAAYVEEHAADLAVKYWIWQQRIKYPGKGWQKMANRGSPTANHMDHVHVSFKATGAGGGVLDQLRDAVGSLPVVGDVLGAASDATAFLNPATWAIEGKKLGLQLLVIAAGLGLTILGAGRLVAERATTDLDKIKEAVM